MLLMIFTYFKLVLKRNYVLKYYKCHISFALFFSYFVPCHLCFLKICILNSLKASFLAFSHSVWIEILKLGDKEASLSWICDISVIKCK